MPFKFSITKEAINGEFVYVLYLFAFILFFVRIFGLQCKSFFFKCFLFQPVALHIQGQVNTPICELHATQKKMRFIMLFQCIEEFNFISRNNVLALISCYVCHYAFNLYISCFPLQQPTNGTFEQFYSQVFNLHSIVFLQYDRSWLYTRASCTTD